MSTVRLSASASLCCTSLASDAVRYLLTQAKIELVAIALKNAAVLL